MRWNERQAWDESGWIPSRGLIFVGVVASLLLLVSSFTIGGIANSLHSHLKGDVERAVMAAGDEYRQAIEELALYDPEAGDPDLTAAKQRFVQDPEYFAVAERYWVEDLRLHKWILFGLAMFMMQVTIMLWRRRAHLLKSFARQDARAVATSRASAGEPT